MPRPRQQGAWVLIAVLVPPCKTACTTWVFFFRPFWADPFLAAIPTAYAVRCILSPLRGWGLLGFAIGISALALTPWAVFWQFAAGHTSAVYSGALRGCRVTFNFSVLVPMTS
jgi:hypothetical protein